MSSSGDNEDKDTDEDDTEEPYGGLKAEEISRPEEKIKPIENDRD